MFLENMSDQEVLALYKKDFDEVKERQINHALKVTRRKALKANRFPYSDDFHCKVNSNDYYIVTVICNKHELKKGYALTVIGSIIDTERGKMFVQIGKDSKDRYRICWYTAHYFRRYAERMGMDKDAPMKTIIKTFFIRNPESCQEREFIVKGGEKRFMACFRDGVGMAQFKNGKEVMMTFLPNDFLSRTQSSRRDILEEVRQEYEAEIKRNGETL